MNHKIVKEKINLTGKVFKRFLNEDKMNHSAVANFDTLKNKKSSVAVL